MACSSVGGGAAGRGGAGGACLTVVIGVHHGAVTPKLALDTALARTYYQAMLDLQRELGAAGEVSIEAVLRAPGVLRPVAI